MKLEVNIMNCITLPETNMQLTDGCVVSIVRYPDVKWVLHHGWYVYNNDQRMGWYLSSIPEQTKIPLESDDLNGIVVHSIMYPTASCPTAPSPPPNCPGWPPPPHPPHPEKGEIQRMLASAFISVNTLAERDALNRRHLLPEGKLVRVNDAGEGKPKYYAWHQATQLWEEADLTNGIDLSAYLTILDAEATYANKEELAQALNTLSQDMEHAIDEASEEALRRISDIQTQLEDAAMKSDVDELRLQLEEVIELYEDLKERSNGIGKLVNFIEYSNKRPNILRTSGDNYNGQPLSSSAPGTADVVVPGSVEYVQDRGYEAFSNEPSLVRHVIFEEGVKQIGWRAFANQYNLDRVEFPESLEWVHPDAFLNSKWMNSQTPGELYCGNVLYQYVYRTVNDNLYMKSYSGATSGTSLRYTESEIVEVRPGTKSISSEAFAYVYSHYMNSSYSGTPSASFGYVLGLKEVRLPEGILGIGEKAFWWVAYKQLSGYGWGLSYLVGIEINLPDSIEWIGEDAFYNSFAQIDHIPPNLVGGYIRPRSFQSCVFPHILRIPDNIRHIGEMGLNGYGYTTVEFGESSNLQRIDRGGLRLNEVSELRLPEGLKYADFGDESYSTMLNPNIQYIYLPSSLEYLRLPQTVGSTKSLNLNAWNYPNARIEIGEDFKADLDLRNTNVDAFSATDLQNVVRNLANKQGTRRGVLRLTSAQQAKLGSDITNLATSKNWIITASNSTDIS